MTQLSVNINKIATLRNARGGNMPDVLKAALDCERFGAQGITVHPRPDERHIRYSDVRALRPALHTEFNIEGNPTGSFSALVCEVIPDQVTLVPDAPDAITSNAGWDTVRNHAFLKRMCASFKERGIRTSIFIDPDPKMAEGAFKCGADRVELYTAAYKTVEIPPLVKSALEEYLKGQATVNMKLDATKEMSHLLRRLVRNIVMGLWVMALLIGSSIICTTEMRPQILGIPALGFFGFMLAFIICLYIFIRHWLTRNK